MCIRDSPIRAQYIRVMFCEIGRILSHILNVTTQAMDVGALTPTLWGFEEREILMGFYEKVSGSRLHANYFRAGGVHQDLPKGLDKEIGEFCERFPKIINDLELLLTDNRIFKQRTPISTFLCLNIRLSVKSNSKSFIIFGNLSQNFPISLSNPFGRS